MPAPPDEPRRAEQPRRLRELAVLFTKLGATAFGGPAAHIALMEDEVVARRRWLTREQFVEALSVVNVIPGPNSTELAIHIGHLRAGVPGLLVAGACFILPATLIVALLAWAYVAHGALPQAQGLLAGVRPALIAIIAQAVWRLATTACPTRVHAAVGLACLGAVFAGVHELVVLLAAAAAGVVALRDRRRSAGATAGVVGVAMAPGSLLAASAIPSAAAGPTLPTVFLFFAKVGSVLFGSGYVLIAFLKADLVDRWGWITDQQLLDAVAVGQVTPGPVFTTATFIGYLLGGWRGAGVATVGIFLPAFVFVALAALALPRLRRAPWFGPAIAGLNVGSLALLASVGVTLARDAAGDAVSVAIALLAAGLLFFGRLSATWVVLGGAAFGLARSFLG